MASISRSKGKGPAPSGSTNQSARFIPDVFPSQLHTEVKGRFDNRSNGLAERIKAKQKYGLLKVYLHHGKPKDTPMDL